MSFLINIIINYFILKEKISVQVYNCVSVHCYQMTSDALLYCQGVIFRRKIYTRPPVCSIFFKNT